MPGTPVIRIHPGDNVAVAATLLKAGTAIEFEQQQITLVEDVPGGHKIALTSIRTGEVICKYGFAIGAAVQDIPSGGWVHTHNLATRLSENSAIAYQPRLVERLAPGAPLTFEGYLRANGRVGTRNEIWVLNTVGCVNHAADRIARLAGERFAGAVDGVFSFSHPYGCSQLGDDLANTQRVLAGLMRHPNAGGVLVLGLGCENNQMQSLLEQAGIADASRLRFFNSQDVVDEVEEGLQQVEQLARRMQMDARSTRSAADLLLGMKCGGSDGLSGITANPLAGRLAYRLTALGGGVLLTEVPEMFGAEQVLAERACDDTVCQDFVRMIEDFKQYFRSHGQPIYENPSPGNKDGGLSTLEEKALGAVQKGGRAELVCVLRYGQTAPPRGLSVLEAPGNDAVSSTALVVSGANLLLFTTGRGTPLGFPVPTVKISSNTSIAQKKPHWIDFNAGALLDGETTLDALAEDLMQRVLDIASGRARTQNELQGVREIAIWKEGVTL